MAVMNALNAYSINLSLKPIVFFDLHISSFLKDFIPIDFVYDHWTIEQQELDILLME